MSLFMRLVGDTSSSEANNNAPQEPQAERQESGPSIPRTCPLRNANTSEDVVAERTDLTRPQTVPQVFDHNTGGLIDFPAERVDFGSLRPVLRNFDQYRRPPGYHEGPPGSHEEPQQYLRDARIELIGKLPLNHPLWDRIRMNGSLKAAESALAAGEPMQEDLSDEEAALNEAMRDVDCWEEEDDHAEDSISEYDFDEDISDEDDSDENGAAENAAIDVAVADPISAESRSPGDVSSESSEEE